MKIAIVEWYPRHCGAVAWSAHFSNQPNVDLLAFSKSGRPRKDWATVPGAWQARKYSEAAEVLAEYDLVVLGDVVCRSPKVDAEYLDVLEKLETPYTAMIHDGAYMGKYTPAIARALSGPGFTGKLLTTRLPEAASRIEDVVGPMEWIIRPYLPWDPELTGLQPLSWRPQGISFFGRVMPNKGWHALLDLFRDMPVDVDGWGFASFSPGTSYAWQFWELATGPLGLEPLEEPVSSRSGKNPDEKKFFTGPWAVRNRLGKVFRYRGCYDESNPIEWRFPLAISLTNNTLRGTLEYATLDAVAGGCLAGVPAHQIDYTNYWVEATPLLLPFEFVSWSATGKWKRAEWDREEILDRVVSALGEMSRGAQSAQRTALLEEHSPEAWVRCMVQCL